MNLLRQLIVYKQIKNKLLSEWNLSLSIPNVYCKIFILSKFILKLEYLYLNGNYLRVLHSDC